VFYIVEQESKLESLERLSKLGLFVGIISSNDNYHPILSSTVAVYLRPVNGEHGYIIPIDHTEGLNVAKERVYSILKNTPLLYTLDKKELLYHFNLQNATDISLLYSMTKYDRLEYSKDNNNAFYSRYKDHPKINKLISISKLFEYWENVYDNIDFVLKYEIPKGFDFYNNTATNVFYLLEQGGLGIYYEQYKDMFKPRDPLYNTKDNRVFTSYNLYNATSRPTNAFNSVNFAAIPKTDLHRKCFRPQNDFFVEFDFDGYHLRLLSEQINYELTEESAHKQLAKLYFGKEEITDEEYAEAKQINFHAIYGKIPEKHAFLEIFDKIQEYINSMWETYNKNGVVYNPISNKPFTKELKDMHPQKLMNYMMQSLETSRNILILKDVLRYLKDKNTKVVLYTYDALLFDFSKADGKQTLTDIQKILESGKKYPVKFKYSNNLVLE
jgi:hypothetical protein